MIAGALAAGAAIAVASGVALVVGMMRRYDRQDEAAEGLRDEPFFDQRADPTHVVSWPSRQAVIPPPIRYPWVAQRPLRSARGWRAMVAKGPAGDELPTTQRGELYTTRRAAWVGARRLATRLNHEDATA